MSETPAPIDVHVVLADVIQTFAELAWAKMGLHRDPMTGQVEKDLSQAKVAIDAATQCVQILEPKLDDEDRRRLNNLLRDLRINYLQRTSESAG